MPCNQTLIIICGPSDNIRHYGLIHDACVLQRRSKSQLEALLSGWRAIVELKKAQLANSDLAQEHFVRNRSLACFAWWAVMSQEKLLAGQRMQLACNFWATSAASQALCAWRTFAVSRSTKRRMWELAERQWAMHALIRTFRTFR